MHDVLTLERLKEALFYDPEAGEFYCLENRTRARRGSIAGRINKAEGQGYKVLRLLGRDYRAHRLAWFYMTGEWPTEIDHIDGDRANNRFDNLRPCTRSENNANAKIRVDNSSGIKGVSWCRKRKKWQVHVAYGGRQIALGRFDSKEEAAERREKAHAELYGEFARLS